MSALILTTREGIEVWRQPLAPGEDDQYFRLWMDATLLPFGGRLYQVHSLTKMRPAHDLRLLVTDRGPAPMTLVDEE